MIRNFLLLYLLFALTLTACSAAVTPEATATTPGAKITLQTNPDPVNVGDVELIFMVVNAQDEPVTGADFDVIADHVDMSGMTMHGTATDQGGGRYSITTNFSMEGNWKLTVQVKNDNLNQKEDIMLRVQ